MVNKRIGSALLSLKKCVITARIYNEEHDISTKILERRNLNGYMIKFYAAEYTRPKM